MAAAKKKRTKKYNPIKHAVNQNCVFDAISQSMPISKAKRDRLMLGIYTAFEALVKGKATTTQFNVISSTIDLSIMMSQNLFNCANMVFLFDGRDALIRCKKRYLKSRRLGFEGFGITALRLAIMEHEDQLGLVTEFEYLQFAKKRDDHLRSGNYYKASESQAA